MPPKWRSARLRRLYGKPDDPLEDPAEEAKAKAAAEAQAAAADRAKHGSEPSVPPAPKRVKREKTRPESEYELVHNMPVTQTEPDYSLLANPLPENQGKLVAYAVHSSRQNWLAGSMFETFWTRKPRGKKLPEGQTNLREKMTKLFECSVTLGPHTFPVKLFTVRDDNAQADDEEEKEIEKKLAEEKQAAENKAAEKRATEERADVKDGVSLAEKPAAEISGVEEAGEEKSIEEKLDDKSPAVKGAQKRKDGSAEPEREETTSTRDAESSSSRVEPEIKVDERTSSDSQAKPPRIPAASTTSDVHQGAPPSNKESSSAAKDPTNYDSSEDKVKDKPTLGPQDETNAQSSHGESPSGGSIDTLKDARTTVDSQLADTKSPPQPLQEPPSEKMLLTTEDPPVANETVVSENAEDPAVDGGHSQVIKPTDAPLAANTDEALAPLSHSSFESERERLMYEKRRNEELELKLKKPEAGPTVGAASIAGNGTGGQPATTVEPENPSTPVLPAMPAPPGGVPAPTSVASQHSHAVPVLPRQQPLRPPPPQQQDVPRTAPNQLVVQRLQQMAARDPSLSELMKHVASGTASPESISKFQEIILNVKASLTAPPPPPPPAARLAPQPQLHRAPATYQPRANSKAIMLAVEFDESPSERFLLPKRSILEYIPQKGELLWSFLHVAKGSEGKEDKAKEKQKEKPRYTPVTATFHGIPLKVAQTLERCVRKPEIVSYYMKEAMREGERSQPWHLWYQIEKTDEVLIDHMRKMAPPVMAPPAPPRKPMKPRKPRAPTAAQQLSQLQQAQREQLALLMKGQPLLVPHTVPLRHGLPFIQVPSSSSSARHEAASRGSAGPPVSIKMSARGAPAASSPTINPGPSVNTLTLSRPQVPQAEDGSHHPPLKLPDPSRIHLPPGGLPPLPQSMQTPSQRYSSDAAPNPVKNEAEEHMEVDP